MQGNDLLKENQYTSLNKRHWTNSSPLTVSAKNTSYFLEHPNTIFNCYNNDIFADPGVPKSGQREGNGEHQVVDSPWQRH